MPRKRSPTKMREPDRPPMPKPKERCGMKVRYLTTTAKATAYGSEYSKTVSLPAEPWNKDDENE